MTNKLAASLPILAVLILPCSLFAADSGDTDKDKSGIERPVTSQEIQQLKNEIYDETHSSVEGIFDAHGESGDLNNKLNFWRYGARLNLQWGGDKMIYVVGTHTLYHTINDYLDESGTNFTVGIKGKPSTRFGYQFEIGGTTFSTNTTTVNALGSFTFAPTSQTSYYVTASRTNVEESLLSATGLRPVFGPFAGKLVGNVMDNRLSGGLMHKFDSPFDVYAEGAFGARAGSQVDSDFFKRADGGVGYRLVSRSDEDALSLVRASYAIDYFGFSDNRLGFGGASLITRGGNPMPLSDLGADGISPVPTQFQPGIGGYFSPANFLSNTFRLEVKGQVGRDVSYKASAFAGWQNFTGSSDKGAVGLSGRLIIRLSDRISIPVTYLRDNFGPFTQQTFFGRLAVTF